MDPWALATATDKKQTDTRTNTHRRRTGLKLERMQTHVFPFPRISYIYFSYLFIMISIKFNGRSGGVPESCEGGGFSYRSIVNERAEFHVLSIMNPQYLRHRTEF